MGVILILNGMLRAIILRNGLTFN